MARRVKKSGDTADSSTVPVEDATLTLVKQQFVDADDATIDERAEGDTARDYVDGKQWTAEEEKILADRGQPVVTDNKIKDKIEYLLGMERKQRTDPKAYPRNTPTDEGGADAATDALRYVADSNHWNYVRSDAADSMFVEGRAGIEIIVEKKLSRGSSGVPKIRQNSIPWDRLYVDPASMRTDYADKGFVGTVTWMDHDTAIAKWPGKKAEIEASYEIPTGSSQTFEDKPRWFTNTAGRKRVQVFDHYYLQKGEWWHCKFVAGGFVEEPAVSAYEDEEGEPDCPIEVQAMYRERKSGRAYGAVRRLKDLQDDWNKRRSKSLHLLNTNQIVMEDGAAGSNDDSLARLRKEAARPDGVIQRVPGMELEIVNGRDLAAGHIQLMMLTGASLDATGPNAALSGNTGSISGRAKQIDQQGGLVAIDKPFDSIKFLSLRVYRHTWNRIRQFWTEEHWIRVRDEEHLKFIALNRKVTKAEIMAAELKNADMPDEEKAAILQRIATDPQYQETVVLNNVAEIDVDITIDESPDVMTLQQEQFAILADLAKGGVAIPPKALIEASALRNKRKILDAMGGGDDPQQQAIAALQQKMGELEAMLKEAQIRKTISEVQKNEAATAESVVDAAVKTAEFITAPATPKTQVSVN